MREGVREDPGVGEIVEEWVWVRSGVSEVVNDTEVDLLWDRRRDVEIVSV